MNFTNTSVNASPTCEFGESTKSTILNPCVVVATVASNAVVELPVTVEPVDVDCTAANGAFAPRPAWATDASACI